MKIYTEFDFDSFKPWSGAVEAYNRIAKEGKGAELEAILDDTYPDGMTEGELNDLLWFDSDSVFEWLGISDEEEEEEPEEQPDPADYATFDDFCQDCDNCPFNEICGTLPDCEKHFAELKGGAA